MTTLSDDDKIAELEKALAIDKDSLDEELIHHSELRWHASELASQWTDKRDHTKLMIKTLEAQLDQKLRDDAAAEGAKITEKEIDRLLSKNAEILKLHGQLLRETNYVRRLDQLTETYSGRRHLLESLTMLFTSNYWSAPRGSAVTAAKEQAAARTRVALNQRRRADTTQPKGEPRG